MEIFTIKTNNKKDSLKIKKVLKELNDTEITIEKSKNPASVKSLKEFQERIQKARASVANGNFLTDEEFENIII